VMLTSPNNGDTNVSLSTVIQVWLSHDLNPGSVTDATMMLWDLTNNVVVAGTVCYAAKCITFTPNQLLMPSAQYQVVVIGGQNGIKDIFGKNMVQNYQVQFYTAASTSVPTPSIIQPADRTLVSQPFTITWTGGQAPYNVQIALDAGFQSIYWPISGDDISVVQATADGGTCIPGRMFDNSFYYVRVCSSGGAWSNTIGFAVSSVMPSIPVGPLNLLVASPSPFAANQSTNQLQLSFDRPINPATAGGIYIVQIPL
jgi:hypothetical protein